MAVGADPDPEGVEDRSNDDKQGNPDSADILDSGGFAICE
jgi:hypothetical protein